MEGPVDNQLICRACLKIVEYTTQSFGYIDDATGNLRDMLLCCVPEMDVFVSYNPIVCIQCIQALINVYQFKSRCINTETIIRTFINKHNMNGDNPVNLGAVVQELIEINSFCKQEGRRHIAIKQLQNTSEPHPHFLDSLNQPNAIIPKQNNHSLPPTAPLLVLEGSNQVPKQSYPEMPRPSFAIDSNVAAHDSELAQQEISEPKPLDSPLLMSRLAAPLPNTANGLTLPVQTLNVSIQHNIVESSTTNNESDQNASNVADECSISEISDFKIDIVDENVKKEENNTSSISEQLISYDQIENKRKLFIRIPRYKITVPYEIKSNIKVDELENVDDECCKTEDATMDNVADPSLEEGMQADTNEDIPDVVPEYIPAVGNIAINQNPNAELTDTVQTKMFNCACMYLTTSETLYKQHKDRCKSAKKNALKCPHCPHFTSTEYSLNKHINIMHTKSVWYHCGSCTYKSTDKSCLLRHVKKNHEDEPAAEPGNQFWCEICKIVIFTEENFNVHMIKHGEPFNGKLGCDFCSYNSKDRSNYKKHIFTHSTIQLKCPHCNYVNVSPYQLRTHIKRIHGGVGAQAVDCKNERSLGEIIQDIREMINNVESNAGNECS